MHIKSFLKKKLVIIKYLKKNAYINSNLWIDLKK